MPTALARDEQRLRELPRRPAARAEIADLAGADEGVERLDRLLDRRRGIPSVDVVEIDEIHSQPLQRRIARLEDVLAREAAAVRAVGEGEVDLRGEDVV